MEDFISFIQNGWWPLEYFCSICLLLSSLKKHPRFVLRLLLGLLSILLINRLGAVGFPLHVMLLLICLTAAGIFYFCAEIDPWDAIYGAVCAYAVQHLAYVANSFLTLILGTERKLPYLFIFVLVMVVCALCFTKNLTEIGRAHV